MNGLPRKSFEVASPESMEEQGFHGGEVIDGRFCLVEPLGKGAFGSVWRADDMQTGQPVAIKFLLDRFRRDDKVLKRFIQEAKILDRLQHPSIAKLIAWDATGNLAYLVLEYIEGDTLDQRFSGNSRDNQPIPFEGIAWICDQLCAAVSYAHQSNVIHRDLKPRNVMVNRRGTRPFVKVLDFGIAKVLVGSEIDPTTVGRVLGSVLYISPEQVLGKPMDARADVFSLGTIMFELLTLRRAWARDEQGAPYPFHIPIEPGPTNSHVAVLRRIAREARPVPSQVRPELSPVVDMVMQKAMAIDPDKRFHSPAQFAAALRMALLQPSADVPNLRSSATVDLGPDTVDTNPISNGSLENSAVTTAGMEEEPEVPTEYSPHLPAYLQAAKPPTSDVLDASTEDATLGNPGGPSVPAVTSASTPAPSTADINIMAQQASNSPARMVMLGAMLILAALAGFFLLNR